MWSYKKAGVDIDKANALVDVFKAAARASHRKEVLGSIGGFGAFFDISKMKKKDAVLVSSCDGVGTKLKIAFLAKVHDTVGIDLVAMSVNDVLCSGAEPLFFLDYVATGRLEPNVLKDVVRGIAAGCRQARCALAGGETAEMPGMYKRGEYDLAGFCVGVVEKSKIIDGSRVEAGNALIGLASSGPHSNGYSLIRNRGRCLRSPLWRRLIQVCRWRSNRGKTAVPRPVPPSRWRTSPPDRCRRCRACRRETRP